MRPTTERVNAARVRIKEEREIWLVKRRSSGYYFNVQSHLLTSTYVAPSSPHHHITYHPWTPPGHHSSLSYSHHEPQSTTKSISTHPRPPYSYYVHAFTPFLLSLMHTHLFPNLYTNTNTPHNTTTQPSRPKTLHAHHYQCLPVFLNITYM